jgi:cytochrome bd-type quinol oxidase subunit 2
MNSPFTFFIALCLVLLGTVFYFLRDTVKELTRSAAAHARDNSLAYAKGAGLVAIAGFAAFDEAFRNLTREQAATLAWWHWTLLFFKPIAAGGAVFVAFIDRSAGQKPDSKPETK